jgi:predicted GNAT family acetyltransferase
MEIKHSEDGDKGRFFIESDGQQLALMTYTMAGTERMIIDHTEVSDNLRGTGAGKKLVVAGAAFARENNLRIIPLCPFAKAVMEKSPDDFGDVTDK